LIVEVHPDPANALSDGDQSLSFEGFRELMKRLGAFAEAAGRSLGPSRSGAKTGAAA
jgi:3-deoxy-7-phosphoheptulonate synthase